MEEYHKSIKSNTGLAKSPTKKIKTQMNHYVLSIVAYIKLEWLKQRTNKNHFAMKTQIYLAAQQAAYVDFKSYQHLELRNTFLMLFFCVI
ncbi:hypothetical protein [Flavobacterium gawalongense]|uniref:Transposase n=1 Tax=Flavobacterium gawalongense TaxID=2594432 RepID=A0A553B9Q0_9FLAO|nr:hypothetical protein [Flavobacterium gawalongense]TRX04986.1 hypothetical protein FNW11_16910 [Flavobacterium gawalongense]TRX05763.1 hypothetical protein FNW10_16905 [Flavobacterium gawalongense]TRX21741.1 hypothetical protein FNW38_16765 [Flavobacterium gawalongense]